MAGRGNVGTAAQLPVESVADRDDPYAGTVLLAEERDRPLGFRLIEAHLLGGDRQILGKLLVDERLDVAELACLNRTGVTEIKAQARRRVLGSRLCRVLRHHRAKACVDHVGRGVSAGDGEAASAVDLRVRLLSDRHRALRQGSTVDAQAADRRLNVVDLDDATSGESNGAVVGQLSAHLGVERRAIQDNLDLGGSAGRGRRGSVNEKRLDGCVSRLLGVSQEGRSPAHLLLYLVEDANIGVSGLL